jgi:predicted MFS family arabinose efflux permease
MFATISQDLGLSLVQIGTVWGIVSFSGIFFALIGGTLGDRFGSRSTLFATCLLTGVFGLARSFAIDFNTLLLASLLFGIAQAIIPVMLFKVIRQWFPAEQLGMASGVISAGFATGLMLGPLISTSVILPALGGWRPVLVFYGGIAVLVSILWLIVHPAEQEAEASRTPPVSFRHSLRYVMGLRNLWILGIGSLGVSACFSGFAGYLPTYLKAIGWLEIDADRALAAFFLASLTAVVPLSILSDRLRSRRGFLIIGTLILAGGIGSLTFAQGTMIVLVVTATGFVFDTVMAIQNASVLEVDGVGYIYAGTALGFATMFRNLGGAISPPIGNSLADIGLSAPFLFWGGMGLFAVFMFAVLFKPQKSPSPEIGH